MFIPNGGYYYHYYQYQFCPCCGRPYGYQVYPVWYNTAQNGVELNNDMENKNEKPRS